MGLLRRPSCFVDGMGSRGCKAPTSCYILRRLIGVTLVAPPMPSFKKWATDRVDDVQRFNLPRLRLELTRVLAWSVE
jgi:hypothetical protein